MAETDGAMPRLKRRRYRAIAAKAIVNSKDQNACMATTPATNVACMKYNGGGDAETICMIDLGNAEARKVRPKKPISLSGIASFHYMEAEDKGVRVRLVADIGPGRLITWKEIKKLHHGKKVVDPRVPLIDVDAAVDRHRAGNADAIPPSNETKPKIHRSHRNVRAKNKMKEMRRLERMIVREEKFKKSVEEVHRRIEEEQRLKCVFCSKVMRTEESLKRHQQRPGGCTCKRGKRKAAAATSTSTTTSVTAVISASNEGEWVYPPQLYCCSPFDYDHHRWPHHCHHFIIIITMHILL